MPSPAWQAAIRRWSLILAVLLGLLACYQAFELLHGESEQKRLALEKGRQETRRMAQQVQGMLLTLEPEVRVLAADLSAGRLQPAALPERLKQALEKTPAASRIGVTFVPQGQDAARVAPFVIRESTGLRSYQLGEIENYPAQNWYQADLVAEGWTEPRPSKASGELVAGFCLFIRKPGAPEGKPIGSVRMDLSLEGIHKLLQAASLGRTG